MPIYPEFHLHLPAAPQMWGRFLKWSKFTPTKVTMMIWSEVVTSSVLFPHPGWSSDRSRSFTMISFFLDRPPCYLTMTEMDDTELSVIINNHDVNQLVQIQCWRRVIGCELNRLSLRGSEESGESWSDRTQLLSYNPPFLPPTTPTPHSLIANEMISAAPLIPESWSDLVRFPSWLTT